ncbi:hypothetical protein PA0359 [Candidatus Phytoplasma australiense]|uniref:DUF2963 domain-containing protein n=1 Tax=Phytoplasma australiense TaxID=59748 RepID=B1V9S2_PHYAS|nr:hypothetical protein PA0359 [Candidatus Phytoplasma australiense]
METAPNQIITHEYGFHTIIKLDPQTKKKTKATNYHPDGKTIRWIVYYDKYIKKIYYQSDGKTIDTIHYFDPKTREELKEIVFNSYGLIDRIKEFEYDLKTGNLIKTKTYKNGTIHHITKFDSKTFPIERIHYKNGEINFIIKFEYNPETGIELKRTILKPNGTVECSIEGLHNPGSTVTITKYNPDKTVAQTFQFLPKTVNHT